MYLIYLHTHTELAFMTSITSYLALIRDEVTQKSKDCVNLNTFGHLSFLHSFCICFFPLHHFIASLSHSVLLPNTFTNRGGGGGGLYAMAEV